MALTRVPAPVDDFEVTRRAMERMFEEPWFRPLAWFPTTVENAWPAMDVYATDEAHHIEVALPGVKPTDVKVSVEGSTLTVSGSYEHASERTDAGYALREIREGAFRRTLTLGGGIRADKIKAEFKGGLLKLTVPRAEEARPRQIEVKVT
jgi:HSP20 family protein